MMGQQKRFRLTLGLLFLQRPFQARPFAVAAFSLASSPSRAHIAAERDERGKASATILRDLAAATSSHSSASRRSANTRWMTTSRSRTESTLKEETAVVSPTTTRRARSLAGHYSIQCFCDSSSCSFSLVPLEVDERSSDNNKSSGRRIISDRARKSWASLQDERHDDNNSSVTTLQATVNLEARHIDVDDGGGGEGGLTAVLTSVLAQWTIQQFFWTTKRKDDAVVSVRLPDKEGDCVISPSFLLLPYDEDGCNTVLMEAMEILFPGAASLGEVVEMVNHNGECLGRVPRKLVHKHNLLHRGIGLFVSANRPMVLDSKEQQQQPDLYCHRRADTKRIFPSLYDMFVGGVSLAGEDSAETAHREVSEELGLTESATRLSKQPLLQCTVCTDYNRCVVTLFDYTMDTDSEQVSWQEEEVAWGELVPYAAVEAAADLSIQRLVECEEWPGRLPAIQSARKGQPDDGDWKTWDFVPDGLLVWEAWLDVLQRHLTGSWPDS